MLGFVIGCTLLSFAILAVYRRRFHPLAKYPGPLLSSITDWVNVYHSWKGDRPYQFYELHKRYGPIVRYGPNRIALCTASGLQGIYGARANTQKANWYKIWEMLFGAASVATLVEHKRHAPRKRIMQQGFSDQAIRDTEETVLDQTRIFSKIIDPLQDAEKSGSTEKPMESGWSTTSHNLSQLFGFLTYDIMGAMVFSKSFHMQTTRTHREYMGISIDALRGLNTVGYIPLLLTMKLDKIFFKELNAGMERYKTFCADQAAQRTAKQPEMKTRDVWSSLLFAKDPVTGEKFTQKDLHSEAAIVISAASHPMRQTLGALTHYALENPRCLAAIRAELSSAFSHVDEIRSGPGLQKCNYLRACLKETLRLSPGLPGNPLRTVLKGGLSIDGNFYPESTDMSVSTYSILHAEEYYPKPFAFIPERWLVRSDEDASHGSTDYATEESLAKANEAFAAFSVGPMACLGKNVVFHQATVVFARMVFEYDIRRGSGPSGYRNLRMGDANAMAMHGEYPQRDCFSAEGDGPWVQFRRRV